MLCLKIIFVRPRLRDKIIRSVVKYRHISHPISFNWHRLKHLLMNSYHSKCVAFAAFAFWHRVPMWVQIWFFILYASLIQNVTISVSFCNKGCFVVLFLFRMFRKLSLSAPERKNWYHFAQYIIAYTYIQWSPKAWVHSITLFRYF